MTHNSLQLAISELQKTDRVGPVSWSKLASSLVHLLKLYSSGLSLPVAVDHLASLSQSQSTTNPLQSANLVGILSTPAIWLLSLPGDRLHAHIPNVSLQKLCLPIGTRLTVVLEPHVLQNASCQTPAYNDTLAIIRHTLCKANDKFADKKPFTTALLTSLSFPSTAIWFHLESFPLKCLQLPLSIDSYTLQRVWDEGSLCPRAVYASIVEVVFDSGMVCLRDDHSDTKSRPIECYFSPLYTPLLKNLQPEQILLILTPTVHPIDESFTLSVPEDSICICSEPPDMSLQAVCFGAEPEGDMAQRFAKRQRIDANTDAPRSTLCATPVDASSLTLMSSSSGACDERLTVHARLTDTPKLHTKLNLCSHIEFSSGLTRIQVKRSKCQAEYRVGDELFFNGAQRVGDVWTADEVDNLSTMPSILLAPFAINLVHGREVRKRITSKSLPSTAHVCVDICSVQVMYDVQDIQLKVIDWPSDYQSAKVEKWEILMTNRCLDILFGVMDANAFWDEDENYVSNIVQSKMDNLRHSRWKMTLTCDGLDSLAPRLCACVQASRR